MCHARTKLISTIIVGSFCGLLQLISPRLANGQNMVLIVTDYNIEQDTKYFYSPQLHEVITYDIELLRSRAAGIKSCDIGLHIEPRLGVTCIAVRPRISGTNIDHIPAEAIAIIKAITPEVTSAPFGFITPEGVYYGANQGCLFSIAATGIFASQSDVRNIILSEVGSKMSINFPNVIKSQLPRKVALTTTIDTFSYAMDVILSDN